MPVGIDMMSSTTEKLIIVEDALDFCLEYKKLDVTAETMRAWCKKYLIGIKVVGRWQVDKNKLKLLLDGRYAFKKEKNQE